MNINIRVQVTTRYIVSFQLKKKHVGFMHWVVFWVLHVSNIRYSKVLSVLKTIHTFYIPEKMHVQSKVTRFMSDYDFSVVGVPSAELTRLRIEGLNHEDNVAGCCCCQPVLSLYHRLPLGSCFYCWYRSIILQRRFPVRLLGVSEFSSHVDGKRLTSRHTRLGLMWCCDDMAWMLRNPLIGEGFVLP